MVMLLVVPMAMAFEFDNVKQYDEQTRTATIKNAFGLGSTIATVQLETPDMMWVEAGSNRLVAVMKVNNVDGEYNNFFSKLDFYDTNPFNREDLIYRTPPQNLKFKAFVVTDNINVDDYNWVCDDARDNFKQSKNRITGCNYVKIGSHTEEIGSWVEFDKERALPVGTYTIGIYVDVKKGDFVEWIPTLFGQEIPEWAGFGEAETYNNGETPVGDGNRNIGEGVKLANNVSSTLVGVGRMPGVAAPTVVVLDASKNSIATANYSDATDVATFPEGMINFSNGTAFYLVSAFWQNGAWGGTYATQRSTSMSYPIISGNVNWTTGFWDWNNNGTGTEGSSQLNTIANVTMQLEGGTPSIPSGSVAITLTLPPNNTEQISGSATFNSTFVPTDTNLTNATLFVSYANGTIFNETTNTVTNDGNFTTTEVGGMGVNTYHWTYRACAINNTAGHNCFFPSDANFTLNIVSITSDASFYPPVSYETSKDTFQTNITAVAGITVVDAKLHYNGSSSTATTSNTATGKYTLTKELALPLITNNTQSQNHSWFFEFNYLLNGTLTNANTSSQTQRVDNINASLLVVGGYTVPFINFTTYEQNTLAALSTTFQGTFQYGLNNTEKAFSYQRLTEDWTNHTFAFIPVNKTFTASGTFTFTAAGYETQTYELPDTIMQNISDGMLEIPIYMLESSNSTLFTVVVRDSTFSLVENANIQIQRYYPGTNSYETTESVTTNADGKAFGHFITEDVIYRFLVYIGGSLQLTSTPTQIVCETLPCTITLNLPASAGSIDDILGYPSNFTSNLTYNNNTEIFTLTYTDLAADPLGARLHVRRLANTGDVVVCSNNDTASASVITCDVSTQTNGTYVATAYLERTSKAGKNIGQLVIQKAKSIVNNIGVDGLILSVFLFMGIVMLGLFKPVLAIAFAVVGIIALSWIGLVSIPPSTIAALLVVAGILAWGMRK